ncbi:NAD(P)/FAD-dependent oxidoreductase [Stappia sp.]|uniref:NAD(P)/FAD-dependent oxidoreductase n=1 Tax=Stappia sp. TaxID=1870903 RepID=UPI003A9A4C52
MSAVPSVHILGAGIVGLAAAAILAARGHEVTLIDRGEPGAATSRGNAAGIAWTDVSPLASPGIWRKAPGWLLDPLGPLSLRPSYAPAFLPWMLRFLAASRPSAWRRSVSAIAALNATALPAWERLWAETGTGGRLCSHGCLDVFDKPAEVARARPGWQLQRDHGIEVRELSGAQIREMEPDLGPTVAGGAYIPGWSHVDDPFALCQDIAAHLRARGVRFVDGSVESLAPSESGVRIRLAGGEEIEAQRVVIACGAWSRKLAGGLGEDVPLDTERGYNITVPEPGVSFRRFIMLPGYGFVLSPLAPGLRIGGAVEFAGLDAPPNWARVDALVTRARKVVPGLNAAEGTRWMGFRPSLPDSLPVISRSSASPHVFHAFGHAHHGLTQAATTGEILADMIAGRAPAIDLSPYSVGRF